MLPKTHRLSKNELSAKTPSRPVITPLFSVKLRKNDVGHNRFAFIISKKIDKRAVVRNTLKRRMAAAVTALEVKDSGYDHIFYMKKAALEKTQEELEMAIKELRITNYEL